MRALLQVIPAEQVITVNTLAVISGNKKSLFNLSVFSTKRVIYILMEINSIVLASPFQGADVFDQDCYQVIWTSCHSVQASYFPFPVFPGVITLNIIYVVSYIVHYIT